MEKNSENLSELITPTKCKFTFISNNTAEIPLKNHKMFQGALYTLFAQADPPYMYKHKKSKNVKPWSFSLLKFYDKPEKSKRDGYSTIKKGMKGYFFLKSIDPKIKGILKHFAEIRDFLHVGKLKILFQEISVSPDQFTDIPPNLDTITIRLETPTFFYDSLNKIVKDFTIETLLDFQCEKFKQLGIMNIDPQQLYPYIWILKNETHVSWGYITSDIKNQSIPIKGVMGTIKFKIVGNPLEKSIIWKILYFSEFTGIGTRTSMGFGHNSLQYITTE